MRYATDPLGHVHTGQPVNKVCGMFTLSSGEEKMCISPVEAALRGLGGRAADAARARRHVRPGRRRPRCALLPAAVQPRLGGRAGQQQSQFFFVVVRIRCGGVAPSLTAVPVQESPASRRRRRSRSLSLWHDGTPSHTVVARVVRGRNRRPRRRAARRRLRSSSSALLVRRASRRRTSRRTARSPCRA